MKKHWGIQKIQTVSMKLLFSYLAIILAPTVAIIVIYITMQGALLDIQKEKAQNLSKEAVVTFNKEMEQVVNIGKYISNDTKLKKYMEEREDFAPSESFYKAYELAKSYPDYALFNRFVENIYILPEYTSYIFQIPQVIPNNSRGMSTLNIVNSSGRYDNLMEKLYAIGTDGLVCDKSQDGKDSFLILQKFNYGWSGQESGIVVVEMDKAQIKNLLCGTLGNDEGAAFLVDKEGMILYVYDQLEGDTEKTSGDLSWEDYMKKRGLGGESITVNQVSLEYNEWSFVTVIPQKELLSKVGIGKYAILLICVVSILIGIAICLWYWNNSRPTVQQYIKFTEKYPEKIFHQEKSTNIWESFGGVLEHVEALQSTVERQKQWAREGILRKLLYGGYESEEELRHEMETADISFPVPLPCFVVVLDMENPMKQEINLSLELLESALKESLDSYLSFDYWMVSMGPLNYTLIISPGERQMDNREMKQLFEKMNYALYSQIPVNIYTGISELADTAPAISEEYEHALRICEYAKYYKLRVPLLMEELPRHQHVVFTVEMEMQLEKTIKSGTEEQLRKLMDQVMENHLKLPGGGYRPKGHVLEVLRCIALRCLDGEDPKAELDRLLDQIQHAKTTGDMENSIFDTWKYFADRRASSESRNEEILKGEIENKIEKEYSNADFNLAAVADWLEVPEKKLYRDFKKMFGVSFSSYLEMLRIRYAQEYLKTGKAVQEVADLVGYGSDYSFRRAFKRVVGVPPSDFQKMY